MRPNVEKKEQLVITFAALFAISVLRTKSQQCTQIWLKLKEIEVENVTECDISTITSAF